jgi:shikimate dehydrogenase
MIRREFGLIGFPLSHSFSKNYFEEKFKNEGIDDAVYQLFETRDISKVKELTRQRPFLDGLNVTIPYKQKILSILDEVDQEAREIGAVNCIKVSRFYGEPFLKGFNTDMPAFIEMIKPYLKSHHEKALVLGTGGAAKAVIFGLQRDGISCQLVSRMPSEGVFTYADMEKLDLSEYPIIINATPVGMSPDIESCPEISFEKIGKHHLLVDLIYNPDETLFLKKGKDHGATTLNGMKMLHLQAEMSWKIWNDLG